MAVTLRFQSTGTVPGDARPVTMVGRSLTIGRGDENDLVLPDPDRQISKRHCAIEDQDGEIIVVDFSTNGTFLNYGKVALGNVPTPLNHGDILTMGSYELLVEITAARAPAGIPGPLEDAQVSPGQAARAPDVSSLLDDPSYGGGGVDFLDDLLGGATPAGPSGVRRAQLGDDGLLPPLDDLLDAAPPAGPSGGRRAQLGDDGLLPPLDDLLAPLPEPEPVTGASRPEHSPAMEDHFRIPAQAPAPAAAIPDDWDDLLAPAPSFDDPFAAPPPPPAFIPEEPLAADSGPAVSAPVPEPAPPVEMPSPYITQPPVAPPVASAPAPGPGATDAAARAFLKAAGAEHLPVSDAELVPTLSRMGHVLRIMIHGLREVLMTRTSIKSEFRISQTMISAGGNNPLKFSISPEQAVEAMVKPTTRGYLDAVEAAEQALQDVKAHEIAMMTGMEAALKGILKRLDPAVLEGKIETSGGIGSILKGKKARYWEVYEKMYAEISDQAENDFHEVFAKEFARAYQDQLERLK